MQAVRPLLKTAAAAGALGLATAGLLAAPAQAADDATVTVIHGVALPAAADVAVWAGSDKLIPDLKFKDIKTLTVPAGTYDLYVTAADATDTSKAIISAKGVAVPGGANATVVANEAGGNPNLKVFVNDTKATGEGMARVTARHTANAPAVDVLVNGQKTFTGLEPLAEKGAEVPAGSYDVSVQAGGADVAGLSAQGLELAAGTAYYAYAVGDADNGYSLLLQTIEVGNGSAMPSGVPAGDGSSAPTPWGAYLLVGAGAAVAAGSGFKLVRTRR
ncbi:MAG: DUF4397 domain-containing protein [Motilibacteraceae bacterium]